MKYFVAIFIMALGGQCFGDDLSQRRFILNELKRSTKTVEKIEMPFVSQLGVSDERGIFLKNTGEVLFSAPERAVSGYDSAIAHDIGELYQANNKRVNIIINKYLGSTGVLASIGFDGGSTTEKFKVSNSKYLGFARSFSFGSRSTIYVSTGRWFGGEVSESPCIDSYDREYWCPNLTAWIDRPVIKSRKEGHFDIVWQLSF
jgi:hypothetical protein